MSDSKHSWTVLRALLVFAVLATLAVVLAPSGSAKPSTKNYEAYVVPTAAPSGGTASLKLTLKNQSSSQQTLGSANFTAPANWTVQDFGIASTTSTDGHNWNVCAGDGITCSAGNDNVVQFRAAGNPDPLTPGASVSYTVTANVVCPAVPLAFDSTWTTEAKQSNDFSGQPGNDFALKASDLEPLGSFSVDPNPIGTQTTGVPFDVTITAKDTCGATKSNPPAYNGSGAYSGSLNALGTFSPITVSWSGGVGTASVKGTLAETGDKLTWNDATGNISGSSNSFDVMDTICGSGDCPIKDKPNNPNVSANTTVPNGKHLGLGFNSNLNGNFTCNGSPGPATNTAILLVDPLDYDAGQTYTLTVTWSKAVSGTGPASGFHICIGKPPYTTWTELFDCTSDTATQCLVSRKRITGGALQAVIRLDPADPGFGGK